MRYFSLFDDVYIQGRWHLGDVTLHDGHEPRFLSGTPIMGNLVAEITNPGKPLDFCLTSWAVPVAKQELGEAIEAIAGPDVQRIHVQILGHSGYEVLNALRIVRCLDERRSEFIKWTERDHRSDLAGQYRQVTRLRVDPTQIPADAHFFRIKDWAIELIVSEAVKEAMESIGCLGATFNRVD